MTAAALCLTMLCGLAEVVASSARLVRHRFSAAHLGTTVHLVFYSADKRAEAAKLASEAFQRIERFDAIFSDYREDSELSILCGKKLKKSHLVSDDLFKVISYAQKISERSGGAFDITLGKETKRWREKGKKEADVRTSYRDLKLDHAKKSILLKRQVQLDLGGIAKGYIADQVMLFLRKSGLKHAAVIIGGETVLAAGPPGKKGWRIGLESPKQEMIGTLELANTAVSTSGDSYQFFEMDGKREAHLIDPVTGEGKANRLNVTTLAPTAMAADAWATALRILPIAEALELAEKELGLEALFIPLGEKTVQTKDFPERS